MIPDAGCQCCFSEAFVRLGPQSALQIKGADDFCELFPRGFDRSFLAESTRERTRELNEWADALAAGEADDEGGTDMLSAGDAAESAEHYASLAAELCNRDRMFSEIPCAEMGYARAAWRRDANRQNGKSGDSR